MRINSVYERNCAAIRELEVLPGSVTTFQGANGEGKSSSLKGLRSCLTKGDFGRLLEDHDGTGHGEVVLIMDDGTEIRRELLQGSSLLTVKGKGFGELKGAKANKFVEEMLDSMSVDAEAFLTTKPKERTQLVLEACPFTLDEEAFKATAKKEKLPTGHPLVVIDTIRKEIYDERTEVNRAAKEKGTSAEQIRKTVPEPIDIVALDVEIAEGEASLAMYEQEKNEAIEHVQITSQRAVDEALARHRTVTGEKRETITAQIEDLKTELAEFVAIEDKRLAKVKDEQRDAIESVRSNADAEHYDKTATLRERIAALRKDRDIEVKASGTRELIDRYVREYQQFQRASIELTDTLDRIDEFKHNVLKELPIPGIALQDGEIIIDGKNWDDVPRSRLCILAVDLAIARAKDSGIVVIDNMEALDPDNFATFEAYLQKCGRQVFMARATQGPFNVRTLPAA